MQARNDYILPVRHEDLLEWSTDVSRAHVGDLLHAVDFEVPEGTPVFAAEDGIVVHVKDDSEVSGAGAEFNDHGNRIVLEHENAEYTAYEHLRYQGAAVRMGDIVQKGQLIGWSGRTGNSPTPHLHFEVFVDPSPDKSEGKTIPVSFPGIAAKRNEEPPAAAP